MKPENHYKQLDYQDRLATALGKEQGLSIRAIARILNRSPSSISRECLRNSPSGSYSCTFAQQRYQRRRRFARPAPKLTVGSALFEQVRGYLHLGWSPEQIAAHLSKLHPCQAALRASHEYLQHHLYPTQRRAQA
jgi:IS30 family transposase